MEKPLTFLEWHRLFYGVYGRVAEKLGVDRSFVNRVALGKRNHKKIRDALDAEIARIEKLKPK